jgi:histidinol-phosphate aminotransferase
MAQAAAVAALASGEYYRKIARMTNEEKQYLYRSFERMGLSYEKSFTNFILVRVGEDSSTTCGLLLKNGVIVRDMAVWSLKGYIRVTIGTPSENKRLIKTLGEVL